MTKIRLTENHWYRFAEQDGSIHIGQYTGRDQGFECCVCGKGCKAYTFNIWHSEDGDYETWGFGPSHLPKIISDLGNLDDVVIDE